MRLDESGKISVSMRAGQLGVAIAINASRIWFLVEKTPLMSTDRNMNMDLLDRLNKCGFVAAE